MGIYAQSAEYALTSPIVLDLGQDDTRLVARLSGDTHLLLEIGAPELDLVLRFRGHALMQALEAKGLDGVIDLTPGIRSLQVHYLPETLPLAVLLETVAGLWDAVCAAQDLKVPSRIVHLPLSWDDPACQLAIEKYMTTVRKDAPWCPSNLEFIRRINDLPNLDEVYRTVFEASYLVMGLGDVYLGEHVRTQRRCAVKVVSRAREAVEASPLPIPMQMLTIVEARADLAEGDAQGAVRRLTPIFDGTELVLAHAVMGEAQAALGRDELALEHMRWLTGHRGRVYAEIGLVYLLRAENIIQSNRAQLRMAELAFALGRHDEARASLDAFRSAWPDLEAIPDLKAVADRLERELSEG